MERIYSISDNPFMDGFWHKSYKASERECGKPEDLEPEKKKAGKSARMVLPPFSRSDAASYWVGRSVCFIVSIPCAIVDLALQILMCITLTFEMVGQKVETWVRGCQPYETSISVYVTMGLSFVREEYTRNRLGYVLNDLSGTVHEAKQIAFKVYQFIITLPETLQVVPDSYGEFLDEFLGLEQPMVKPDEE